LTLVIDGSTGQKILLDAGLVIDSAILNKGQDPAIASIYSITPQVSGSPFISIAHSQHRPARVRLGEAVTHRLGRPNPVSADRLLWSHHLIEPTCVKFTI
jgi:hypothetical protein